MEKQNKVSEFAVNTLVNFIVLLIGVVIGTTAMFYVHEDAIMHRNRCQEKVLEDSLAKMRDEHVACFRIGEARNLIRGRK